MAAGHAVAALVASLLAATGAPAARPPAAASSAVPRHVAFIPDGNGRWATARGLPRSAGHTRGAQVALATARACFERGVEAVTFFGLSTENCAGRAPPEVRHVLSTVCATLRANAALLARESIGVRVLGDAGALPAELAQTLAQMRALREAEGGRGACERTVCIALAYGGKADLVRAARALAQLAADGQLAPGEIDEAALAARLGSGRAATATGVLSSDARDAAALPDIDLVVRTSGERRLSNFMLWQCAYAELQFEAAHWPEWSDAHTEAALQRYAATTRRFGRAGPS